MPSGGIHLCIAKTVADILTINNRNAFYIGNVAPDSWRHTFSTKEESHFISSSSSFDYNYELFYKKYKSYLDNDFVLGYLIHLMADKYWYSNNFITSIVSKDEYIEVNKACSKLISLYNIKPLQMKKIINPIEELDSIGIEMSINYNNRTNFLEDINSKYNIDELIDSINKTSKFVINELERLKNNQKIKKLT